MDFDCGEYTAYCENTECIVHNLEPRYETSEDAANAWNKQVEAEWVTEVEYCYDDFDEFGDGTVRNVYTCSRCGRTEKKREPYCHCGARMKGANNEQRAD